MTVGGSSTSRIASPLASNVRTVSRVAVLNQLTTHPRAATTARGFFVIRTGFTGTVVSQTSRGFSILRNYPQDRYKFTRYYWYARRRRSDVCTDSADESSKDSMPVKENEPRKVARMTSSNCRREDQTTNATTTPNKSLHPVGCSHDHTRCAWRCWPFQRPDAME